MDTVAFILSFEECSLSVLNKKWVFQFGRPSHLHAGHQALPEWDSQCKSGEYSCALAERVAFFLVWANFWTCTFAFHLSLCAVAPSLCFSFPCTKVHTQGIDTVQTADFFFFFFFRAPNTYEYLAFPLGLFAPARVIWKCGLKTELPPIALLINSPFFYCCWCVHGEYQVNASCSVTRTHLNPYSQTIADCIGRTETRKSGVLYIYIHIRAVAMERMCVQ
jgi:hypothetical protein